MSVWLGIDGTNWIHQLFHALRGVDVVSHARRRVKILADYTRAAVVLVCFDRRSFRHDLSGQYKSSRRDKEPRLRELLSIAESEIADVGQPVFQEGFEADDCLATLADVAVASGVKAILASGDKDIWQCLRDGRVSVLRNFGTHGTAICHTDWQTERDLAIAEKTLGLEPSCWADYQSLVGERGDDIPGCPGWGPETSRRGLAKFGSIEAMLRDPWSVHCSKRQMTQLQAWAKADTGLQLTRQLVTLRTDVEAVREAI